MVIRFELLVPGPGTAMDLLLARRDVTNRLGSSRVSLIILSSLCLLLYFVVVVVVIVVVVFPVVYYVLFLWESR